MGRTGSGRVTKTKMPVWNGSCLPENLPTQRLSRRRRVESTGGLLSSGRVQKCAKPLSGRQIPGGLAPRLKQNQSLFEGLGVLNRGKAKKKVGLSNFDIEKLMESEDEDEEEEVMTSSQVKTEHAEAGGKANLMGPLISSPGETLLLTEGGKLIPQRSPKMNVIVEEEMRSKVKWNCLSCVKFLQNEKAVEDHLKQAQISFSGRRKRMQFKPTTCKIVKERVFNEEEIQRRLNQES